MHEAWEQLLQAIHDRGLWDTWKRMQPYVEEMDNE